MLGQKTLSHRLKDTNTTASPWKDVMNPGSNEKIK